MQFGKTWWGQQWLNALSNIDFSNRLPRGSAYARKGAVLKLEVDNNEIKALVEGSRPEPYKVRIIVPPFFPTEVKRMCKVLTKRPSIISKLLNRELDTSILEISKEAGLRVFPESWSDLKMQCSCPDWAVPCKHLAAVVYKFSTEIDNDPFLVFSMHNVNLVSELEKEGVFLTTIVEEKSIFKLEEWIDLTELKKGNYNKKNKLSSKSINESFNFASLQDLGISLHALLTENPSFYDGKGDFKSIYSSKFKIAVKEAQRVLDGKRSSLLAPADQEALSTNRLIAFDTDIAFLENADDQTNVWLAQHEMDEWSSIKLIINEIWELPVSELPRYQETVQISRQLILVALNLLAKGAVVPRLFYYSSKDGYLIRWLPAMLSPEVRKLVNSIYLPEYLYCLVKNGSEEVEPLWGSEANERVLSLLLTEIITVFLSSSSSGPLESLFFGKGYGMFNKPGESAIPGAIQQWLERYYLSLGEYKPVIEVSEIDIHNFGIQISIRLDRKIVPIREILINKEYDLSRFSILKSVFQVSQFIPQLDTLINNKEAHILKLSISDFTPFILEMIPVISLLDLEILLPKSLQHILKPKVSLKIKPKDEKNAGFFRLDQLLSFEWKIAIGDELIDVKEFEKLLLQSNGLIRYKANYIQANAEDLVKLSKHFEKHDKLNGIQLLAVALTGNYMGAPVQIDESLKEEIRKLTELKEIPLPQNLKANLRPYQQSGYSWMYRNAKIGFGSVLADDMGLGKTLQVITTILKLKEDKALENSKVLLVAPTGLLTNWQSEIEKFAPTLRFHLYHGMQRKLSEELKEVDIVCTSYGTLRSDADKLKAIKWKLLVTDETQNIKNPAAGQSKAVKSIPAELFIAMSGTPVENRLSELWSIMDFANRGYLGNLQKFQEELAYPIQNRQDQQALKQLKTLTAPFMMRRLKTDKSIINDLPDKVEIDSFASLTKEQAALYENTLQKAIADIEGIQLDDQRTLFVRQGLVLQMILALKQICNHPSQFLKDKQYDSSLSGKTELLLNRLEGILENNEKVLIFTQFTEMGELLKRFITEHFSEVPLFYHGGCNLKQRKEMVDAFQNQSSNRIFILSLKAAGTGLNLTAASHVIHYDLWWNPAVEAQATDRAFRIGQKNKVMVHRFITKGTFEERINSMIQSKKNLAELTVSTGETWIGNLSNSELRSLFVLGE